MVAAHQRRRLTMPASSQPPAQKPSQKPTKPDKNKK